MIQTAADPLFACIHDLKRTLAADPRARDARWVAVLHAALDRILVGIDDELQSTTNAMSSFGAFPRDSQNMPAAHRHASAMRRRLLWLGEMVQSLRAAIAKANYFPPLDLIQWTMRGEEIVGTYEKYRDADDDFLFDIRSVETGTVD